MLYAIDTVTQKWCTAAEAQKTNNYVCGCPEKHKVFPKVGRIRGSHFAHCNMGVKCIEGPWRENEETLNNERQTALVYAEQRHLDFERARMRKRKEREIRRMQEEEERKKRKLEIKAMRKRLEELERRDFMEIVRKKTKIAMKKKKVKFQKIQESLDEDDDQIAKSSQRCLDHYFSTN